MGREVNVKPLMFSLVKENNNMPLGVFPLKNLIIEILLKCNLNCSFCYASATSTSKRENELTTQEILQIIHQAKKMGVEDIDLTGGEPLLHKDILKIVKEIINQDLLLTIQTNATLISKHMDLINFLTEVKDRVRIFVSLNGATAKTHDELYGVTGAFDKTLEGIKILTTNGIRTCIATTYQEKNFDEIPKIIYLSKKLGAEWSGGPIINTGRGSIDQFDPLVKDFIKSKGEKYTKAYSSKRFKGRDWQLSYIGCNAGITGCIVLSNGDVISCFMEREHIAGNIREQPLDVIWKKGIFPPREVDNSKTLCSSCKFLMYCCGGCTYFRKVYCGNFDIPPPSTCAWFGVIAKMTKEKIYEKINKKDYVNIKIPNTSKTFKD